MAPVSTLHRHLKHPEIIFGGNGKRVYFTILSHTQIEHSK